ncbi:hypothetical protein OPT61_g3549 [Boeremia exigua]|uniref:Uncharacterized protein n=1 Tax=Boeremia exigua TaxID=749465 RepID=A0ACC2IHJ6_9PLEO|nr:hypothetical protein OPT61_g3549 [Boeremia exigua]
MSPALAEQTLAVATSNMFGALGGLTVNDDTNALENSVEHMSSHDIPQTARPSRPSRPGKRQRQALRDGERSPRNEKEAAYAASLTGSGSSYRSFRQRSRSPDNRRPPPQRRSRSPPGRFSERPPQSASFHKVTDTAPPIRGLAAPPHHLRHIAQEVDLALDPDSSQNGGKDHASPTTRQYHSLGRRQERSTDQHASAPLQSSRPVRSPPRQRRTSPVRQASSNNERIRDELRQVPSPSTAEPVIEASVGAQVGQTPLINDDGSTFGNFDELPNVASLPGPSKQLGGLQGLAQAGSLSLLDDMVIVEALQERNDQTANNIKLLLAMAERQDLCITGRDLFREDVLRLCYIEGRTQQSWYSSSIVDAFLGIAEYQSPNDTLIDRDIGLFLEAGDDQIAAMIKEVEEHGKSALGCPFADLEERPQSALMLLIMSSCCRHDNRVDRPAKDDVNFSSRLSPKNAAVVRVSTQTSSTPAYYILFHLTVGEMQGDQRTVAPLARLWLLARINSLHSHQAQLDVNPDELKSLPDLTDLTDPNSPQTPSDNDPKPSTTSKPNTMRVLISGAGVAGPTLAFFLAKTGSRITVAEKASALLPHGQNVDVTGSAVTVVKKMGLFDELKRHHTKEKGTQLIDPRGRPFAPFPVREGAITSFTSEFEILRGDMARIVWGASRAQTNVEYVFGTTVQKVLENSDAGVKVQMSDGAVREFDLLVAADGQWSKIREQCFRPESVEVVDKGMYVVYFTVPRLEEDNDWWNVFFGLQSRIITLRPDPYGTTRAMFTIMPRSEAQKSAWQSDLRAGRQKQEELVRQEFADAGWQAERLLDAMSKAPDFYFQAVQQIRMDKWSNNRVVCLGDTAFAPTPLTGMGTSLALIGGYMLAGELAKVQAGEHPKTALEAYESKLRPFVEQTQRIPGVLPGVAHPDTVWKRWLLQTAISTMARAANLPWFVRLVGGDQTAEQNTEGFTLPQYEDLDRVI